MKVGIGRFLKDGLTRESVESALRRMTAAITAGFAREHREDGTHAAITADSIALDDDPGDGSFSGNMSGSLVPIAEDQDLGAVLLRPGADPVDHPWGDLRLSGTLYLGAAWEETVIDGIPTLFRDTNGLTINIRSQTLFKVTGTTAGTLQMQLGTVSYTGAISAATGFVERGRTAFVGEWTTQTYAAGNFTGSGAMTWDVASGDVTTNAYTLIGKTLLWNLYLATTSTGGVASSQLRATIPGGFTCAKTIRGAYWYSDAGGALTCGIYEVLAGDTFAKFFTASVGSWSAVAVNNTSVFATIPLEVQ